VTFDVLEEEELRLDFACDARDFGPEMAGIVLAAFSSCAGERLAGIAGRDETNLATPRAAVEGSKVRPDRRVIQGLVCHPRHESGRSECVPLDIANSSISGFGQMQAELEPADTGAEGDSGKVTLGAGGSERKDWGM
jgi:hypothetical protein